MSTTTQPPAYKQAPWRRQIQIVGAFMLVLVIVATIAGLYLSISGRAAAAGRRIQQLEMRENTLNLEINDLRSHLAKISSSIALNERIGSLNMQTIDPHTAIYLEVPGYSPDLRKGIEQAPLPEVPKPQLSPEYTSSLWDWLREKIWTISPNLTENPHEAQP